MPIQYQDTLLYSPEEISQTTSVPLERLLEFIHECYIPHVVIYDEQRYIEQSTLPDFFEKCFAYLQISPSYYEIPSYLQHTSAPWAQTLLRMYANPFAYGTSLSPEQGQFLRNFVCNIRPETIVEIGSFIGISTIWMASGLELSKDKGVLHAIDLFYEIMPCFPYRCGYLKNPFDFAQHHVSSAQLSHRIHFHRMNSYEMGQHVQHIIKTPIDLLYIDGDHSIRGCLNDLALFAPYVKPKGYIILHDIYPEHCGYDGPRYVIDHVIKKSSCFSLIEMTTAPYNYGIAIIQKLKKNGAFYSGGNLQLDYIRLKAYLKTTTLWKRFFQPSI